MEKVLCACGKEATTEVQTGWNPLSNNGAGGGNYEAVCEECYNEAVTASNGRLIQESPSLAGWASV
jgi:thymidine kinase